ncbi:MAG: class I SAM-dependent methyltransferase [Chloroflexota bacterium]
MPDIMNKKMVEQMFDSVASSYNRIGPDVFTKFGGRLAELTPIPPGSRVLDIAAGSGAVLIPAAKLAGVSGHVTGIDLSAAIIEQAKQAASASGLTNVSCLKMDAEHLDFPDASFDVVTCGLGLFLMPDMDGALCEMYRVCKPGGYIGVTFFNKIPPMFSGVTGSVSFPQLASQYGVLVKTPHPTSVTPEDLDALLCKHGFHPVKTQSETYDVVYKDMEERWQTVMTGPHFLTMQNMSEEVRERIQEDYFNGLRPALREDGLHLSVAVIYSVMQR